MGVISSPYRTGGREWLPEISVGHILAVYEQWKGLMLPLGWDMRLRPTGSAWLFATVTCPTGGFDTIDRLERFIHEDELLDHEVVLSCRHRWCSAVARLMFLDILTWIIVEDEGRDECGSEPTLADYMSSLGLSRFGAMQVLRDLATSPQAIRVFEEANEDIQERLREVTEWFEPKPGRPRKAPLGLVN